MGFTFSANSKLETKSRFEGAHNWVDQEGNFENFQPEESA